MRFYIIWAENIKMFVFFLTRFYTSLGVFKIVIMWVHTYACGYVRFSFQLKNLTIITTPWLALLACLRWLHCMFGICLCCHNKSFFEISNRCWLKWKQLFCSFTLTYVNIGTQAQRVYMSILCMCMIAYIKPGMHIILCYVV